MYLVVEKYFLRYLKTQFDVLFCILKKKALINQENLWGQTSDAVK